VLILVAPVFGSVTINATFLDQQGNPVQFAYLEVSLENCQDDFIGVYSAVSGTIALVLWV